MKQSMVIVLNENILNFYCNLNNNKHLKKYN